LEGKNISIEWRIAPEGYERLTALASELVDAKVDLILTGGDGASKAAMNTTKSVPLVFTSGDPIIGGYAKTLSHPGANATGVYVASPELEAKRLEFLLEMVPRARRVAYLRNPDNPLAERQIEYAREAAKKYGVQLVLFDVTTPAQTDSALQRISRKAADAAMVSTDVVLVAKSREIASALRKAQLPVVYPWRLYVDQGGLLYYGVDVRDVWRRAVSYIDRLLKGAKPSDLAIEQVSTFQLVINVAAAKELGIDVPQSLLARADEIVR
jgi:putative ABC transport system substrate-binding protein